MNRFNHLHILPLLLATILLLSCRHHPMTEADSSLIKDSVRQLTTAIARDVSTKGPAAWLDHFDDAPGFFMASDGSLDFPDYNAAKRFILDTLVKNIPKITLSWTAVRVYPLSRRLAAIGADFHEVLTTADGKDMPVEGYFSGTAALTGQGWKLLNLHWSTRRPGIGCQRVDKTARLGRPIRHFPVRSTGKMCLIKKSPSNVSGQIPLASI